MTLPTILDTSDGGVRARGILPGEFYDRQGKGDQLAIRMGPFDRGINAIGGQHSTK
jgi:hypothetical protein